MKLSSVESLHTLKFISVSITAGLIGFVFLPILTRSLSIEDFKSFSKSLLYVQMVATPSLFGISAYLTTLVEKMDSARGKIQKALSDWFFLLVGLAVLMLIWGGYFNSIFDVAPLILISYARAFHALGAQSYRLLRAARWFAIYQVGIPATFFSTAIIGYELFTFPGTTLFYFSSIVYFFVAFHSWHQFKMRGWIRCVYHARFRDSRFLRFALGAFMHSLAGVVVTSWDKAYTASALGPHDFSIYIVGAQYAAGLVLIYAAISQAVVPKVYALLSKENGRVAACVRYLLMMGALFILLFILFEIAIGELMRISLPVSFHSAIPIAQLLGVAALLQGFYFISSSVLFYYHRTFSLAAITMMCGVFGAIMATVTGVSDGASIADITLWVWAAFFSLTTVYSGYLVIKK